MAAKFVRDGMHIHKRRYDSANQRADDQKNTNMHIHKVTVGVVWGSVTASCV